MTQVWLDIARLLERACLGTLTGIDRVELAYAETLPGLADTRFVVHRNLSRRIARLPTGMVRSFLSSLRQAWQDGTPQQSRAAAARLLAISTLMPSARAMEADDGALYLLVSHRHLDRPRALRDAIHASGAAFVPMIHDVIPLDFPEYARPGERDRHRRRMQAVAALADGVVVNSRATGDAVRAWLPPGLPMHPAPLGLTARPAARDTRRCSGDPYFLCVGTIEPRKNHLLLLHLWRRLVLRLGADAPRLVLVGHRGWENENILDLLDRCPAMRGHVQELGAVSDVRLSSLIAEARAVLMPSFAEGYGLPVAEALAHGTPVLCSNLPALRETGASVPEYLDPMDGLGWERAVLDYTPPDSQRRARQIERLSAWKPVPWDGHVRSVLRFSAPFVRARSQTGAALPGGIAAAGMA